MAIPEKVYQELHVPKDTIILPRPNISLLRHSRFEVDLIMADKLAAWYKKQQSRLTRYRRIAVQAGGTPEVKAIRQAEIDRLARILETRKPHYDSALATLEKGRQGVPYGDRAVRYLIAPELSQYIASRLLEG